MPSAQPISAARIIRNSFLKYGWGASLSKETNDIVTKVKEDASAMYQLQISRDRPISSSSLRSAVFWEHRHLTERQIVSTPAIDDELELFLFSKDESFEGGLNKIRSTSALGRVNLHPIFGPMRDRPYTIWPIRVDGIWVTIIFEITNHEIDTSYANQYFDRRVTKFAVIDPYSVGKGSRRELLKERLPQILAQGCIQLPLDVMTESFLKVDIQETWATGLVAYAVCREFIRRLRVLLYRKGTTSNDFLWEEFEEHYDFDVYRESLMAACAHQAIEKSGYLVRLALEVPSEKSEHKPYALIRTSLNQPDEVYKNKDHEKRDIVVNIPDPKSSEDPGFLPSPREEEEPIITTPKNPPIPIYYSGEDSIEGPQVNREQSPLTAWAEDMETEVMYNTSSIKRSLDDEEDSPSKRQRIEY